MSFRKEISGYVSSFLVGYDPQSEVLVTVGVSEAIDIALRAILNPGDKVLYHEPCYVSYAPSVTLAHGEAIPVGTIPDKSFSLDSEAFEKSMAAGLQKFFFLISLPILQGEQRIKKSCKDLPRVCRGKRSHCYKR